MRRTFFESLENRKLFSAFLVSGGMANDVIDVVVRPSATAGMIDATVFNAFTVTLDPNVTNGIQVNGLGGADTLNIDVITGGIYFPVVADAGDGNDVITGVSDNSNVTLMGGAGKDTISTPFGFGLVQIGGIGDDKLYAGPNDDTVFGGAGNDYIVGGTGSDQLFGETGADLIDAGIGHDYIGGGIGNDIILAGAGNDTVFVGPDEVRDLDLVCGGTGYDTLIAVGKRPRMNLVAGIESLQVIPPGVG